MSTQPTQPMNIDQMMGRYQRLQHELSIAYTQQPWPLGRIDRLAQDLAQVERELALGRNGSTDQPASAAR